MALKDEMPLTADFVAERRREWGDEHVTDMVRRAMQGERGCCYSVEKVSPEQYRTFGAPFDTWSVADAALFGQCTLLGLKFAGIMRPPAPPRGSDGAH
jgi:hypothetical protein